MIRLNEAEIRALPIPSTGNKVVYFAGAVLQGQPAPRGFGVRVTAAGVKSFVLNYRIGGREYRYTIGRYPEWSALRAVRQARELRQRIDRGENPLDDRAPARRLRLSATYSTISWLDTPGTRIGRCAALASIRARLTGW